MLGSKTCNQGHEARSRQSPLPKGMWLQGTDTAVWHSSCHYLMPATLPLDLPPWANCIIPYLPLCFLFNTQRFRVGALLCVSTFRDQERRKLPLVSLGDNAVLYPPFWRRQRHPTPVLLPGKSHGRRSLVGCSPWGRKESDTTERLHFHFSLSCIGEGNSNPVPCSWLENPRDRGAWWAAVSGVAESDTTEAT